MVTEAGIPLSMIYDEYKRVQHLKPIIYEIEDEIAEIASAKSPAKRKNTTERKEPPKKLKTSDYQSQISRLFRKNSTLCKIDLKVTPFLLNVNINRIFSTMKFFLL